MQYKDFNSIIPPPEPRAMGIFIYKEIKFEASDVSLPSVVESIDPGLNSAPENEEVVLTEVLEWEKNEDIL